jgi:hypothetical protein
MSKYGHRTINWFEAIVNKLGGEDAAEKFLQGKLVVQEPVRCWREEDGVIYFEVVSDGTSGPAWIERLENKGFRLSKWAKDDLNSKDFKPTSGVTYRIAVLKGTMFSDDDRITSKIRAEAERRKLEKPNAEIACLIREMFSDEELEAMGLWWIVVFHEPIKDSGGAPHLLAARRDSESRWLRACYDGPGARWNSDSGFAFVVSQVSSS